VISDRLERLVEEMVDRSVQFDDAVREFEKRFICASSSSATGPDQDRVHAGDAPQHAHPQDGEHKIKRRADNAGGSSAMGR
jgi:hypothetical protein